MLSDKKRITIITPCYNEADNIALLTEQIRAVMTELPDYDYEHIFIDNASTDCTVKRIRAEIERDSHIKAIVNSRNFGHIRSPFYALLQAQGDAAILLASDLQDPPALIKEFIAKWEKGYPVVVGQKSKSEETPVFFLLRKCYYRLVNSLAEVELLENVTGFGLYDKRVIEAFRNLNDPYPYARGLISELGFNVACIVYKQPTRKRGISKNNWYTLYDIAMLGITSHSKVPLRLATIAGFGLSFLNLLVAAGYFMAKIVFWSTFQLGLAPLIIGLFFFASVQLFTIGILGEYIGFIHTQVLRRPLVIERERLNFSTSDTEPGTR